MTQTPIYNNIPTVLLRLPLSDCLLPSLSLSRIQRSHSGHHCSADRRCSRALPPHQLGSAVMSSLRCRGRRLAAAAAFALLFFATALGGELSMAGTVEESEKPRSLQALGRQRDPRAAVPARRRLVGPGSSPPTCRARCGSCAPCRPVHVVIQPSRTLPLEYYPEAWRCQCGHKLFMP